MLLSSILAVIIGLLFLWIVLSFATIQIQEWISTRLGKRAQVVEMAIHEMLANPNLKAQFYDHPVIRALTTKLRKNPYDRPLWLSRYPIVRGFTREERKLPSYIPSEQFALALFDILMTTGTEASLILQGILKIHDDLEKEGKMLPDATVIIELKLLADMARSAAATEAGTSITHYSLEGLKTQIENFTIKYPEYRNLMDRVLEEARRLKVEMYEVLKNQPRIQSDKHLANLRRGVAALSVISPELNQTLNALILNAEIDAQAEGGKIHLVKENIEKWFDNSMDRVSGVFKRYSQTLAFIIGIYLAILLNIDVISFTVYLWREAYIRQALIENPSNFNVIQQAFVTNPEQAIVDFREEFASASLPPIGWTIHRSADIAFYDDQCQLFPTEGQAFGIPLFFSNICISPPNSNDETNIFLKLFGFFMTALFARLGAPFWFDVMKRLVNVRLIR